MCRDFILCKLKGQDHCYVTAKVQGHPSMWSWNLSPLSKAIPNGSIVSQTHFWELEVSLDFYTPTHWVVQGNLTTQTH